MISFFQTLVFMTSSQTIQCLNISEDKDSFKSTIESSILAFVDSVERQDWRMFFVLGRLKELSEHGFEMTLSYTIFHPFLGFCPSHVKFVDGRGVLFRVDEDIPMDLLADLELQPITPGYARTLNIMGDSATIVNRSWTYHSQSLIITRSDTFANKVWYPYSDYVPMNLRVSFLQEKQNVNYCIQILQQKEGDARQPDKNRLPQQSK